MLAVDEKGEVVDGDQIVAILALDQEVDQVAVTVMTNLGFHALMSERGIRVHTTDVGDRYVLEALQREGAILGGEQSGHIIFLRDHVTGDGLAAGLLLCGALKGRPLSEVAAVMPRYPQVKENVRVAEKELTPAIVTSSREAEPGVGRQRPHSGPTVRHRALDPRPGRGGECRRWRRRPVLASPPSFDESSADPSRRGDGVTSAGLCCF